MKDLHLPDPAFIQSLGSSDRKALPGVYQHFCSILLKKNPDDDEIQSKGDSPKEGVEKLPNGGKIQKRYRIFFDTYPPQIRPYRQFGPPSPPLNWRRRLWMAPYASAIFVK